MTKTLKHIKLKKCDVFRGLTQHILSRYNFLTLFQDTRGSCVSLTPWDLIWKPFSTEY